jgi:lysyl-tRNA synthetase class II
MKRHSVLGCAVGQERKVTMSANQIDVKDEALLPLPEAIHECERELQVRQRCYSRWVAEGKLTEFEATERSGRLSSAIGWLKKTLDRGLAMPAQ